MEANGLPGEMFSSMSSGMLGLEMSLNPHQPPPQQNPRHLQQHPQPQMVAYGHHEAEHHHHHHHPQTLQSIKQGYPYATKAKPQQLTLSDEDEPGLTAEDSADEAGSEGSDHAAGKKKGGGVLQKKGKWKSVSKAMMEKGFYVSPQQCEDKFNDLNKRYKRVNDILGKGTACRVVENQSLLETMDHLSPKMKDEVKKLLNSKHLFFREMCAYHNSCGGGAGGSGGGGGGGGTLGAHHSPEVVADPSQIQQHSQQQRCFHSSESAPIGPNSGRAEIEGLKMTKGGSGEEEEEDEDDEDDEEEDEDEVVEGDGRVHEHGHEEDDEDEKSSKKRPRRGVFSSSSSPLIQQLSSELVSMVQDGTKSSWEKRQWMKMRLMQLEEQGVSYQCHAFELEKQRLKWVKFSSKKEREMEREKLQNEWMRLENERMVLLLRKKELELIDLQQQQQQQNSSNKRNDPS
ncbi:hypothetical protein F0562_016115 [Nyssa sinensis]|uniref:Myb/SANT-like DNA-binding domain-containing protein n=1 Tax=Nyssa sinensis TaxID=561372 RepID=A0A5J4ZNJ7_9ASTE|nr:hypothetical protein F0562_016115 [Nyssa sinensis]